MLVQRKRRVGSLGSVQRIMGVTEGPLYQEWLASAIRRKASRFSCVLAGRMKGMNRLGHR